MLALDTKIRKTSVMREIGKGIQDTIQIQLIEAYATRARDPAIGDGINELQPLLVCEGSVLLRGRLSSLASSRLRSISDSPVESPESTGSVSGIWELPIMLGCDCSMPSCGCIII